MTDWKQKIEAQIAYLTTMLGVQSQQRSKPSMMLADSIESLQALLDVAVAADYVVNHMTAPKVFSESIAFDEARHALDKLREVGDE